MHRKIKTALNFSFFCFKTKGQKTILKHHFWRSNCEAHHEFLNSNKKQMSKQTKNNIPYVIRESSLQDKKLN